MSSHSESSMVDFLVQYGKDDAKRRSLTDADNKGVTSGQHAEDFEARHGKTHFVGRRLSSGDIWQARGVSTRLSLFFRFID